MEVPFTRDDFKQLAEASSAWDEKIANQEDRWEEVRLRPDDFRIADWKFAYWVGESWLHVVFMRAWLEQEGERYSTLWDLAREEYVVLTNYDTHNDKD